MKNLEIAYVEEFNNSKQSIWLITPTFYFNADCSDPGNKKSNEKYVHCNDDPSPQKATS